MAKQKLELTWIGKSKKENIEPRILIEDKEKSYGDSNTDNMLIHGDNLLALKALEDKFTNRIKCIYIDPPYNTGAAFEQYDDNIEHSIWINLMKARLEILRNLLNEKGTIFIQIDNTEYAYLKVLCDEIFGRQNFLTTINCKVKSYGGLTSNEAMFFDVSEYILVYAKCASKVTYKNYYIPIELIDKNSKTVANYNQTITDIQFDKKQFIGEIKGIKYYRIPKGNFKIEKLNLSKMKPIDFYENRDKIFRLTALSGGLGKKLKESTSDFMNKEDLFIYEYVPTRGRDEGKQVQHLLYKGARITYLNNYIEIDESNKTIMKTEGVTNMISNDWWQGIAAEGGVTMNNGKKPEKLLQLLLNITTEKGDWVLDSFLGSGTTCAVAHKMQRKWIGVELGEQCYTHCKKRLDGVIEGEQSGISKNVSWNGGGGYKFYELAPSLLVKDKFNNWVISEKYNGELLSQAICKQERFTYCPDKEYYWKQGKSSENDYIYITTNYVSIEYLQTIEKEMKEDESLLICCKSHQEGCDNKFNNITIKKIPQAILNNCEYGRDDYSLNVKEVLEVDDEDE